MKRVLPASIVFLLVLAIAGFYPASVQALLLRTDVDSTFVVVDDVNSVQWADLNRFTDLTYEGVLDEIAAMNTALFAGAGDWHLADRVEMEGLFAEVLTVGDARQFEHTSGTTSPDHFCLGRYDQIGSIPDDHLGAEWGYDPDLPDDSTGLTKEFLTINYRRSYASAHFGAWVLSSAAAPSSVPEPATLILLGSGLIGLAGLKRKIIKDR